ncbi:bifunctional acetate--CoA ligase family protein/GNAT family N-acetyltransferase [Pleurocapsales cyanobacterium LEGE 06147]|nr:bifunctional acetate--CoA ligase family protein/GNAT family N-acetyltransferase [Pleurocapsales cyanobacterium LEGE 06147]
MLKKSKPTTDPAYDILRSERQPLSAIFAPQTIAAIGATDRPGSVGRTLLRNLLGSDFGGIVFPINPHYRSVLGVKAYPQLKDVSDPIDLAIIATPAPTVPGLIDECIAAGVKGAIVISAGFRETGEAGVALEQEILQRLRRSKLRLLGPNCLGVMNPLAGLNATFAQTMANPGHVGFISQSGALCTAVLDWSLKEHVGFSAFISIGSMLDIGWGDLIYYLGDDPQTRSIVIYMESIGDARSFLSAGREVALTKPIIVIKAGETEAAAKAAASHTGALASSDAASEAAFRRCGVLRVKRISELFNMAEVLGKRNYRLQGSRLTIITNAGGPGVLATDALVATGGKLAKLSEETIAALDKILPSHWSRGNPIDILGDADPERYTKAFEIAIQDSNSDGLLVILTPQAMTDPTRTAEKLRFAVERLQGTPLQNKPILASWMGGAEVAAGEQLLNRSQIPTYPYPDSAARLFTLMWKHSYNLQGIYETPSLVVDWDEGSGDRTWIAPSLQTIRQSNRTLLTEWESKQILSAYGIPVVETRIARSEDEAVKIAEAIAYPVVLKLHSETITHKTDIGGVKLDLTNAEGVRRAYREIESAVRSREQSSSSLGVTVQRMIDKDRGYELIIGSSIDEQFGPILLFGAGGRLAEVLKDRAIALPPLNTTLARRLMEQTKIYEALQGVRGRSAVDFVALEQMLVRFSQLVVEQRWIKEIDINPLLAFPSDRERNHSSLLALDARIILHKPTLKEEELPKLAIRPYPTQYVQPWTMKNGMPVTIRPIRPEDEPLMVQFHKTLSERSIYFRYFHLMKLSHRVAHERLIRSCFIDYDREMVLVAERKNSETGNNEILAVGRLSKLHGFNEAEFAMVISDFYQHQGLGTELLRRLVQIGRDEGLARISADILPENRAMQQVCQKIGFRLERAADLIKADLNLTAPGWRSLCN